jgi:hypothetical protein
MALPSNFWEEFDRRLDAKLDEKLEEKFSIKLAPVIERLDKIENRLKKVENWTKRQDNMIEYELKEAARRHLEERFKGYITISPTVFPQRITGENGLEITEFDGLLVLTNNPNVIKLFAPPQGVSRPDPSTIFTDGTMAYLVIVEAKQHMTSEKVKRKLRQREAIEHLLTNPSRLPRHFQNIGFDRLEKKVGLYIGRQDIDPSTKDLIKESIDERRNAAQQFPFMGWIELNGARFSVNDVWWQERGPAQSRIFEIGAIVIE